MRTLFKFSIPCEAGNRAILEGTLAKTMKSILEDIKPEAAYFGAENGMRTAYIVVDMKHESDIPRICEPFFLAFNATAETQSVMVAEDLMKAGPHFEEAVRKYGRQPVPAGR